MSTLAIAYIHFFQLGYSLKKKYTHTRTHQS